MRKTTLNRGQGSTNFIKDVSMLILALEKIGVHIIFARIVALEVSSARLGERSNRKSTKTTPTTKLLSNARLQSSVIFTKSNSVE